MIGFFDSRGDAVNHWERELQEAIRARKAARRLRRKLKLYRPAPPGDYIMKITGVRPRPYGYLLQTKIVEQATSKEILIPHLLCRTALVESKILAELNPLEQLLYRAWCAALIAKLPRLEWFNIYVGPWRMEPI